MMLFHFSNVILTVYSFCLRPYFWQALLFYIVWLIRRSDALLFFGDQPVEYLKGQFIDVKATTLSSGPFGYPYEPLKFCLQYINGSVTPKSAKTLRDSRFIETQYKLHMAENISCKTLCYDQDEPSAWNAEETRKAMPILLSTSPVQL